MVLAVEAALERLCGSGAADGRPVVVGQVDVRRQHALDGIAAAVDLRCEPCQLCAGTDLVHTVRLAGLRLGGTVPCVGGRSRQRNGLGQHAAGHLGLIGTAQREAVIDVVPAGAGHRIGVLAVAKTLVHAVGGCLYIACGIRQRHGVGLAGGNVGDIQLHVVCDLLVDLDLHIREAVQAEAHRYGIEVRTNTRIGHVVQGGEGVGRRVHGTVGVAVGEADVCRAAGGYRHILRDGQGHRRLIHLLILGNGGRKLLIVAGIVQVIDRRVEDAGILVNTTVAAFKGERHLIAGHDVLAGIGCVLDVGSYLRHTGQAVGRAAVVGHLDDDRTASQLGTPESQQACMIAAVGIRRQGSPAGELAFHCVLVGGDNGVLNCRRTLARHGERYPCSDRTSCHSYNPKPPDGKKSGRWSYKRYWP